MLACVPPSMSALSPLLEAFLVIEQPRQRFGHWSQALSALDSPDAPPLASVIALYDPTSDQALLELRYDELAVGAGGLTLLGPLPPVAATGMIQPAAPARPDRPPVPSQRLSSCRLPEPTPRAG